MAQVNELLREEIGKILIAETSDPILPALTVTEVRTSPDLSSARVFIMCRQIGEPKELANQETMDYAAELVQKRIGSKIRLKKTPHLHFVVDEAEEQASRIEDLLNQVKDDLQDDEWNT